MGHYPVERGLFRGTEAVEQGTKQPPPLCPTAQPRPCATPLPCSQCSNRHLAQSFVASPFLPDYKEAWLASSPFCLPLHLPLALAPGPFSPRMSLFQACLGDLAHVITWVSSPEPAPLPKLTLSITLCSVPFLAPLFGPISGLQTMPPSPPLGRGQHEGWDRKQPDPE